MLAEAAGVCRQHSLEHVDGPSALGWPDRPPDPPGCQPAAAAAHSVQHAPGVSGDRCCDNLPTTESDVLMPCQLLACLQSVV